MLHNINKTLRIITDDNRVVTGKLLVFDKHMNVVMGDVVETRPQTKKMEREGVEATRELGLILLRGEHVVSVTVLDGGKSNNDSDNNKTGASSAERFANAPKAKKAGVQKRPREEEEEA